MVLENKMKETEYKKYVCYGCWNEVLILTDDNKQKVYCSKCKRYMEKKIIGKENEKA